MKETTKQSIAIFVITLLFAATIFVINTLTLDAYNNYQLSRIKIQENKETLIEIANYKTLANELTAKYQSIGGDFTKIRMALPSSPQFAELIGTIDSIARTTTVNVSSMAFREIETMSQDQNKLKDYNIVEINLTITGRYEALVSFFEETEKELRLMDVININLKKAPQVRNVDAGMIEASVIMNAYYQTQNN